MHGAETTLFLVVLGTVVVAAPLSGPAATSRAITWLRSIRWPVVVYCCSRLALLLVAGLDGLITHRSFGAELSLFDGQWYLRVASHGYPAQALHAKSTLGFLPLYPLAIRGLAGVRSWPPVAAALLISFTGGLVAAVLVRRLAAIWWGEATARRAVLLFCLFPGSVVFSMVYSECLTLPLVLGCLLALRSQRWLVAGLLAGLASAVEPAAVILFPVCLVVAWRQVRTTSWRDPAARRSLLAPLLAPSGLAIFAVYLWIRHRHAIGVLRSPALRVASGRPARAAQPADRGAVDRYAGNGVRLPAEPQPLERPAGLGVPGGRAGGAAARAR